MNCVQSSLTLLSSWVDENKSIFQVMQLEKIGLFVILTLIVVVAAFNIISSLIMLVLEKSRKLRFSKQGATDQSVRRIFMMQGVVIGLIGTCSGVGLGLTICWALATFEFIDIPPGVYPGGDRIPVLIDQTDVLLTTISHS